jgi:hypothetical protein
MSIRRFFSFSSQGNVLPFVSYVVDILLTYKLYKIALFFGKLPYFKFRVRHELSCNIQLVLLI